MINKKFIFITLILLAFMFLGCLDIAREEEESDIPGDGIEDQIHYRRDVVYD